MDDNLNDKWWMDSSGRWHPPVTQPEPKSPEPWENIQSDTSSHAQQESGSSVNPQSLQGRGFVSNGLDSGNHNHTPYSNTPYSNTPYSSENIGFENSEQKSHRDQLFNVSSDMYGYENFHNLPNDPARNSQIIAKQNKKTKGSFFRTIGPLIVLVAVVALVTSLIVFKIDPVVHLSQGGPHRNTSTSVSHPGGQNET
jgi:hypothetical protein